MGKPNYYQYISIFAYYEDGISITFPDLPGCVSHGDNERDAMKKAKEVLMLHLYGMEVDNDEIPAATTLKDVKCEGKEIIALIEVFMPPFRERQNKHFVKKTLSIPFWLNAEAENMGVNFSQTLQEALKQQLNIR